MINVDPLKIYSINRKIIDKIATRISGIDTSNVSLKIMLSYDDSDKSMLPIIKKKHHFFIEI